MGREIR